MLSGPQDITVIRFTDVISTNFIALNLGKQGAKHGTVVIADQQSAGRGRIDKDFFSPPGGLYMSIILRPEIEPEEISFLTIAAGVACCNVVKRLAGLTARLKWPNDLYLEGRKLGGILTESSPYSNAAMRIPFLVVGIGLNVNTGLENFPPSLQESVTSLYFLKKRLFDTELFMKEIVLQLDRYSCKLENLRDEIIRIWQDHDYLYGKRMKWLGPAGDAVQGVGTGLQPDGRYRLRTPDGSIMPILGGELSLL